MPYPKLVEKSITFLVKKKKWCSFHPSRRKNPVKTLNQKKPLLLKKTREKTRERKKRRRRNEVKTLHKTRFCAALSLVYLASRFFFFSIIFCIANKRECVRVCVCVCERERRLHQWARLLLFITCIEVRSRTNLFSVRASASSVSSSFIIYYLYIV